ncbi:MAG: hypothetical protein E7672_09995 [Ruminococcaceae bacterium]|nr:hypothetical protein [Oscillospiraceae bacterium]
MTLNIDQKTLAYINMYGVLGSLTVLCDIVPEAKKIIEKSECSIGFSVKGGPEATLSFAGGKCTIKDGVDDCVIKIPFSSCEKFNGMVNGTSTPIPTKGITKISFLLGKFTKLTDLLEKYLRADESALADETFLTKSTIIMFRVIVNAIVQIGNHDKVGQFSASNIVDGAIKMEIPGTAKAAIIAKDNKLTFSERVPKNFMSYMAFENVKVARDLFDGKINSVAAVGEGKVRMAGMISQIDNVNRILSRVEMYLK